MTLAFTTQQYNTATVCVHALCLLSLSSPSLSSRLASRFVMADGERSPLLSDLGDAGSGNGGGGGGGGVSPGAAPYGVPNKPQSKCQWSC